MKPTLIILAAGIGSRFGGLKQVEPLGPNGEFLIDYSIFDALRAGFGKVIIVIRKEMEKMFEDLVSSRFRDSVPLEFAFQDLYEISDLSPGSLIREKPWGTGHAILACSKMVSEPFCVINADDFYGPTSYQIVYSFLEKAQHAHENSDVPNGIVQCGLIGYELQNTLSDHGSVSRGICNIDSNGHLTKLVERTKVKRQGDKVVYHSLENGWEALSGDELVSVNLWGFTPDIFDPLNSIFLDFLDKNIEDHSAEFFITTAIDKLIRNKQAVVKVLQSSEKWFGVTHSQDKSVVKDQILGRIRAGDYPEKLWD